MGAGHVGSVLSSLGRSHPCQHRRKSHRVDAFTRRFVPPAKVLEKHVYSPWTEGRLVAMLNASGIEALVVTGGETDVCVLAAVLGAIDRGYRVVLVTDAMPSVVRLTRPTTR